MSTSATSLPQALKLFDALSHADKVAAIVALYQGNLPPAFDPMQRSDSDLSFIVKSWAESGAIPAPALALACARAVTPPAPVVPAPPAPAPQPVAPAPVAATPTPPAPQPAPQPAPKPAPAPQPVAAIPPQAGPRPSARGAVLARELFADQPPEVTSRIPAALSIMFYAHADAPRIDPDYAFDGKTLAAALGALACDPCFNLWLAGPRGTGKTEFARQLAGRLGRPFFRVNFNRSTDAEDLLGGQAITNGDTHTKPGPIAIAAATEGALCLLDEPTYAVTAHTAALNPILERDGAIVRIPRTGEKLTLAPGVAFVAADNTGGHGATSNEYHNRSPIGSDTLDRFGKFLQFDYLPANVERRVLRAMVKRACGTKPPQDMARAVCKLVAVTRAKADAGELEGAPSLRRAVAFCVALVQGFDAADAYVDCILNAAPQDSQEALRQIFAATWDHGNAGTPAGAAGNPFADPSQPA